MYHDAVMLMAKLEVISDRKDELERAMRWDEGNIDFIIADIQALCREVANDTGDTGTRNDTGDTDKRYNCPMCNNENVISEEFFKDEIKPYFPETGMPWSFCSEECQNSALELCGETNEYIMMPEGCAELGIVIEAVNAGDAIAHMKEEIPRLMYKDNDWNLYLVVRDKNPELHDAVDDTGEHHTIFVYRAKLDEDGEVVGGDGMLFDETISMTVEVD